MPRAGQRSARLNERTRLVILTQPPFRSSGRSSPYLYRVALQTIVHGVPSDVYLSYWTEDASEVDAEFDDMVEKLQATEDL